MSNISTNRTDEAISMAMKGLWDEAIELNKSIIEIYPNDAEAHNRLGKALASKGLYDQAKEAYEGTLRVDPANNIAKKNIQRLANLNTQEMPPKATGIVDSSAFIEETGKARIINLYRIAGKDTLSKISAGDSAYLQVNDQSLVVVSESEDYLGELDARTTSRLIELMEGGNQYQVVIANIWGDELKVIIRETYQHPSQVGHPSFPPRVIDEPKPYLKDTMVRYDIDDDISDDEPDEPGDIEGAPEWDTEDDALDEDKDDDSDDDDLEM